MILGSRNPTTLTRVGAGRLREDSLKKRGGEKSCNQCSKTQVQGKQGADPGSGWGRVEARLIWSALLIWGALNPLNQVSATVGAWLRACPIGQGLPGTAPSSMWEELLGEEPCREFWRWWRIISVWRTMRRKPGKLDATGKALSGCSNCNVPRPTLKGVI